MIKSSIQWLAAVLVLSAGVAAQQPGVGPSLSPATLERLRAATVYVTVADPATGSVKASGTGFFTSPDGDILTPRHLAATHGKITVAVHSGEPNERRVPAKVARADDGPDIALLKAELADAPYLPLGDSARLRETEGILTVGFPLGSNLRTGEMGPAISFRPGAVSSLRRSRYGGLTWLEISSSAESGSSGSPVVDANGAAVGMVVQLAGRGTVLAVPSRRLISFAGERARLAPQDESSLRAWLADPLARVQDLYETGRFVAARDALKPLLDRPNGNRRILALDLNSGIEERLGNLDGALSAYERLVQEFPADVRATAWKERTTRLKAYRGDGNPRNNFLVSAITRGEAAVLDAGTGQVLETIQDIRLAPYAVTTPDGHYAYTRSPDAITAIDLVIPQEATHLRREHPEVGTPDWISASRDGQVVAAGISPVGSLTPPSTVMVYHGPNLSQAHMFRFDEFLPAGFVASDGKAAYLVTLVPNSNVATRVRRLDLSTGKTTDFIPQLPGITWISFPAGTGAAYALRADHKVLKLDLATGKHQVLAEEGVNDIEATPESGQLLLGSRQLVVWDARADRALHRYPLPFEAQQVGTTADGAYLYAADAARERVAIVDSRTGRTREVRLRQKNAAKAVMG